jgi:hypothetical protein
MQGRRDCLLCGAHCIATFANAREILTLNSMGARVAVEAICAGMTQVGGVTRLP